MQYFFAIAVTLYNLTILGATVYLVEHHHWSPLWFLVAILFIMNIRLVDRR